MGCCKYWTKVRPSCIQWRCSFLVMPTGQKQQTFHKEKKNKTENFKTASRLEVTGKYWSSIKTTFGFVILKKKKKKHRMGQRVRSDYWSLDSNPKGSVLSRFPRVFNESWSQWPETKPCPWLPHSDLLFGEGPGVRVHPQQVQGKESDIWTLHACSGRVSPGRDKRIGKTRRRCCHFVPMVADLVVKGVHDAAGTLMCI